MKISFKDFIRSLLGRRDENFRKRLGIFLTCLIISVIIWFTVKMSNEYDTVIQMPLRFTNVPADKVITFVSDSTLQVEVVERGSNLFRMLYLDQPEPVTISLRFTPFYQKDGYYSGIITPSLLINEIEREQSLLGKIISVSPDTIYLRLEPEKVTKVPVRAKFDLQFEKQYMSIGKPAFEPDCVIVRGPGRFIEGLDSASLGTISLRHLKDPATIYKIFDADSNLPSLTFEPEIVKVSIPVTKFTESSLEVPIEIINSNNLKIKAFPEKVKITYTVSLENYKEIEPGLIRAVVDYSTTASSVEAKLKVKIDQAPPFIYIKSIEPEKVEYIIIK